MVKEIDCTKCTVKREGEIHKFDVKKVHKTCYSACIAAGIEKAECVKICKDVEKESRKKQTSDYGRGCRIRCFEDYWHSPI